MDRLESVWDSSSRGRRLTCDHESSDVQDALCCFNMPTMPRLFDTSGIVVAEDEVQQSHDHATVEQDSPGRRGRRGLSMEQKQVSNREHQRRFRERAKARSQAIETQLAETVNELRELKLHHHQLEVMLEKAYQTSKDQLSPSSSESEVLSTQCSPLLPLRPTLPSAKSCCLSQGYILHQHKFHDVDTSPLLSISVQGRRSSLTSDEVRTMPTHQFAALWTAYVHELGECLLRVDDDKQGLITRRLILLSVEGMRLLGRRLLQNPAAHKALITANLVQGQPTLLHLDADFYTNLVVSQAHQLHVTQDLLELLEEQVADLMHLRHLYLTKRALLALQRKALIHSLASFDSQLVHPSDNSATAEEVAAHLKDIAFEDQAVLYRIARAVWVGILSSKQLALVFVHAYPYIPILEILLNTIATREGYPAPEEVSASAQQGASMTAAWNDFDVYSMSIHQNMFSEERGVYVPLSWHTAPPAQSKPCYNDVISAGHLISA